MNNSDKTYRIALDAMGGDFAPINEIQGAIQAYKDINSHTNIEIIFVGKESKIMSVLSQYDTSDLNYSIVNADEVVTMSDEPTIALKSKKNSSLYKGLEIHSQGYADAFISAGNTGAVMSVATVLLGRIKGVSRPTIGTFIPTNNNYPAFILDVGANVDSKPRYLYEFAVMGSIFATQILGLENPRVALLNIGEEKSKGNEGLIQTYQLIEESQLNFIGNVEGKDILLGSADVIVCDGFIGNALMKFAESVPNFLKSRLKIFASESILKKVLIVFMAPVLRKVLQGLNYENYGGVPLLGVNGSVIIGHGRSTPKAFKNMIIKALDFVKKDLNKKIENALNPPIVMINNI
jgi:phosphate acyltransferase